MVNSLYKNTPNAFSICYCNCICNYFNLKYDAIYKKKHLESFNRFTINSRTL